VKRSSLVAIIVISAITAVLVLPKQAEAQILNPALAAEKKAKKIYRGSMVIYENIFNLRQLDVGADLSTNPYYAQSLTFLPQIWLGDTMFVNARLSMEVEITSSDFTNTKREPFLSDLFLTYMWLGAYTIPVAKIVISPSMRIRLPTSKFSQNESMLVALAPGVSFARAFKLHKGKYFSNLQLMYAFRYQKNFNEYTTGQASEGRCSVGAAGGGGLAFQNSCINTGARVPSSRFVNAFTARTMPIPGVFLTVSFALINDILYRSNEATWTDASGVEVSVPTNVNSRVLMQGNIDVTVPVAKWMFLSAGLISFHNQLDPSSSTRAPFFNRFTNFYFDVTIPIAPLVSAFGG
jgi:hypothetical protein